MGSGALAANIGTSAANPQTKTSEHATRVATPECAYWWKPERVGCKQCWQRKRGGKRGAGQAQTQVETNEASEVAQEEDFPYLAAVEVEGTSQFVGELLASDIKFQRNVSVPMPHHIIDGTRGWMQAPVEPHPVVTLKVFTDESDYNHLCLPCPKMRPQKCPCVADSGCQSVLLGLKVFHKHIIQLIDNINKLI